MMMTPQMRRAIAANTSPATCGMENSWIMAACGESFGLRVVAATNQGLLSTRTLGNFPKRDAKKGERIFALRLDWLFCGGFGGGLIVFHGSVLDGLLPNGRNLPPGPKLATATYMDFALLGRTPLSISLL